MSFDGISDFDARILPSLRESKFFRLAPETEIDVTYEAYRRGGVEALIVAWRDHVEPLRVTMPGIYGPAFARAGWAPESANGIGFLGTVRGAIEAGKRFRARLKPEVRRVIETEFPWLEKRHEHVGDGFTLTLEFPDAFRELIEAPTLDETRARWQLITALNEVQQTWLTRYLADHFRIPVLHKHADREQALARNYFAHGSPEVTRALWRQTVLILDAMNSAVFDVFVVSAPALIKATLTRTHEWKRFQQSLADTEEE